MSKGYYLSVEGISKRYLFCESKMVYERVRGWPSRWSLAVKKFSSLLQPEPVMLSS